ncbi:hypothetical protein RSAG8_02592, partial [Rhizoctonia solani AG-8 WAC10335]
MEYFRKFTRLTMRKTPASKAEELLRPLVTCGICMDLYVDPVALLDCLHLACGSCAKEWLEKSPTCHQCREKVRGARDSHHTAAIVETFQSIAPNSGLVLERTAKEISVLRERYRPGQGVVIQTPSGNAVLATIQDTGVKEKNKEKGSKSTRYLKLSELLLIALIHLNPRWGGNSPFRNLNYDYRPLITSDLS